MKKSLFLVGALFSALTLWTPSYGQSINYTLEPSKNFGYLTWEEPYEDGLIPVSWGIRYYSDAEGDDFLFEELLNSNYFHFTNEDLESSENYFQIVSYDANDDEITDSDIQPICPSCFSDLVYKWICNGTTYAYEIKLLEFQSTGEEYLSIGTASRVYTGQNGYEVSEPYLEYMDDDIWNNMQANSTSIPYEYQTRTGIIIDNDNYKNAQGSLINGNYVAAIDKTSRPFNGNPTSTDPVISTQLTANSSLSSAISKFNNLADYTSNGYVHDPLVCVADPNGSSGPIWIDLDGNYPSQEPSLIEFTYLIGVGWDLSGESIDDGDDEDNWLDPTLGLNDRLDLISQFDPEYDGVFSGVGSFDNDKIERINIININGTAGEVVLQGADLYDQGTINYPEEELEKGLYKMFILFTDGTLKTLYFDKVETSSEGNSNMADNVSVTVYPTPVDGDYNLNVTSSNMTGETFSFSLMDLNGYELYSSVMTINSENELYSISYLITPTTQLVAHKLLFSDGSTKVIKTYAEQ